jgi:hypothetical protein
VMRLGNTVGAWDSASQPSIDAGSGAVAQRSVVAPLGPADGGVAGVAVGVDDPHAAVASTRASSIAEDRDRDMPESVAAPAGMRRPGARMAVS